MAQNVARLCRCEFNSAFLSNSQLRCFEESPQIVTFRSQLSETSQTSTVELVSYIELWISDSEGVAVDGVFLGFQTTCSLVINSLDAVECSTPQNDNLVAIVGGVMAAVLLFILVGVAIVTLTVFIKKQRTIYTKKPSWQQVSGEETFISCGSHFNGKISYAAIYNSDVHLLCQIFFVENLTSYIAILNSR